jgi:hypothetical protein
MKEPTLCIFANFFIDNEERLQRMKDSFHSFKKINPDLWVINIRGRLNHQAGYFLKKQIEGALHLFYLQNRQGWFYDSRAILNRITADYILFWIEDHILIAKQKYLKNCIVEMKKFEVDQLWYSWFCQSTEQISIIDPYKRGNYITAYKLDSEACIKIRDNIMHDDFYTISCQSIMRKDFFIKVLLSNKPYLKRWSRYLPFDFEKKSKDKILPVIYHALPNKELFVSIDDDQGVSGYSLISRGLYSNRVSKESLKKMEFGHSILVKKKLKKKLPKIIFEPLIWLYRYLKRIFYTIDYHWFN